MGTQLGWQEMTTCPSLLEELQICLPDVALTAPVLCLGLSRRAQNCLERANLATVGQLASATCAELLGLRNFGVRSLSEVRAKLREFAENWEPGSVPEDWVGIAETSIEAMGLAVSTQSALLRLGITQVGHLRGLTEEALTSTGCIDMFGAREALARLAALLGAGDSRPDPPREPTWQRPGLPIDRLGLSPRPLNALIRAGIHTVDQVEAMGDAALLCIHNFGRGALAELRQRQRDFIPLGSDPLAGNDGLPDRLAEAPTPRLCEYAAIWKGPVIGISRVGLTAKDTAQLISGHIWTVQGLIGDAIQHPGARPRAHEQLRHYADWLAHEADGADEQEALGLHLNTFQREALHRQTLEGIVSAWLSFVGERNARVLWLRLGLQGEPQTLEEIGCELGLSRERIRQLQAKSLRILRHQVRLEVVAPFLLLLQEAVAEAGGVVTPERLARALARAVTPGAVDPVGVVRLIAEVTSSLGWHDELGVWVHPEHDPAQVLQAWEALRDLLWEHPLGLPRTHLIARLKGQRQPAQDSADLDEAFISACMRTCADLRHDSRTGDWYVRGRMRPGTRQVALALRRIGRPAHYSEIAAEVNAYLGRGRAMAQRNVHARLGRESEHFAWVGKRGTYGLTEWRLEDLPKRGRAVVGAQSRAMLATLREHRRPMALPELVAQANGKLLSDQHLTAESARAILESEAARFSAVGEMYAAAEWIGGERRSARPHTEGVDAPQELAEAIGQVLRMAGCALTPEQIAAQLPLLGSFPDQREVVVALGRQEFRALGDGRYWLEREIGAA